MRANLRAPFLITATATYALGCSPQSPFAPNPPGTAVRPAASSAPTQSAPPPIAATKASAPATEERLDLRDFPTELNPTEKGRAIFRDGSGGGCYVELDFPTTEQRKPGQAPPHQSLPCPKEMSDPAWEDCREGAILRAKTEAKCICFRMGNPPPLPDRVRCPAR